MDNNPNNNSRSHALDLRCNQPCPDHYDDVIMGAIASQITSLTVVYSIVYSDADQSKHQSSASLAFVRGIHRGPVNSPHKWPITRKMFPFHGVIMRWLWGDLLDMDNLFSRCWPDKTMKAHRIGLVQVNSSGTCDRKYFSGYWFVAMVGSEGLKPQCRLDFQFIWPFHFSCATHIQRSLRLKLSRKVMVKHALHICTIYV